ncbi:chemotaxis protein CheW [Mariniblastus fucicola]|uniref:Chemotaxis protein CheW n=1 Tax=Mariniblastus fucicola TaxID=980251 RepID=A0A5B9P932_9BACT|nr:chemotaxis protein CheW [Mariniblastus fucicola]QEG21432.1 Chemotaxis protein CheW [Mariniblastus fucicola]
MTDPTNILPSDDPLKADVQKALLAAFGEEAIGWLDEADDLELEVQADESPQQETESSSVEITKPDQGLSNLLDQISAAIEGSSTDALASGIDDEADEDGDAVVELGPRYVVFEIGDQQYGIPLDGVLEIDRCGKVTSLPRTPAWLRGVTNLRGQILSVTDFRDLLGLSDQRRAVGEKIIVVHSESHDSCTALVVDRVLGIRNLRGEQGPLEGLSDRLAVFADSLAVTDQATTVLIDPDLLLGSNELSAFAVE